MTRSANALAKVARMNQALRHQEPDQVPISDFFWGRFLKRWREELGLAPDTDIYRYYDLDWIVTVPNMDPHIRPFEVLEETPDKVVVRTGFGATIEKRFIDPMPIFHSFDTDTVEKMEAFTFDDPRDDRRFFAGGDNQIAGVGDGFARNVPPWIDGVKSIWPDFAVYGSVCEANEMLIRIVGSANALLWMGMYPDAVARFVERLNEYNLALAIAQMDAADGLLDGMVIWGDVAYRRDLLFSPDFWRAHFKPGVAAMVAACHERGLPVIYHGCGNVLRILEDYVEIGVDAYNPLEAKAGLDAVALRKQFGHRIGFCGNMDVMAWAESPMGELERIVRTKLNAAKGGGFIFQSDHSVPDTISGERYDTVVRWVRQYGRYPLQLGDCDVAMD